VETKVVLDLELLCSEESYIDGCSSDPAWSGPRSGAVDLHDDSEALHGDGKVLHDGDVVPHDGGRSFLEAWEASLAAWVGNAFQGHGIVVFLGHGSVVFLEHGSVVFLVLCKLGVDGVQHKKVCMMEVGVRQHMMVHVVGCKREGVGQLRKKGPVVGECMLVLVVVLHKMVLGVEHHMLVLVHCMQEVGKLVAGKLVVGKMVRKVVLVQECMLA
jgi:hypothetical protein